MKVWLGLLPAVLVIHAASFDAASIKPGDAGPGDSSGVETNNGLFRGRNVTLKRLIVSAYGIPEPQIVGIPKSMEDLRYEIIARAEHVANEEERMSMIQALLAERFKLALHRETQSISGYTLTPAKSGIKATPSDPETHSTTQVNKSGGRIDAKACPMSRLVMKLSDILSAPVSDLTNDNRNFDITLQWIPDTVQAKTDVSTGPTLFTALQEQLGLKLESRKVPVEMLIVDHAEPASEN